MNKRERLMKRLATYDFSSVDMHLYLDTHPNDREMIDKMDDIEKKASVLRNEYEENYGPLSPISLYNNPSAWINTPWPWDGGEK